jgi:hypothetical protein
VDSPEVRWNFLRAGREPGAVFSEEGPAPQWGLSLSPLKAGAPQMPRAKHRADIHPQPLLPASQRVLGSCPFSVLWCQDGRPPALPQGPCPHQPPGSLTRTSPGQPRPGCPAGGRGSSFSARWGPCCPDGGPRVTPRPAHGDLRGPAEHYGETQGRERRRQLWSPVNSLISQCKPDSGQGHQVNMCVRARPLPGGPGGPGSAGPTLGRVRVTAETFRNLAKLAFAFRH